LPSQPLYPLTAIRTTATTIQQTQLLQPLDERNLREGFAIRHDEVQTPGARGRAVEAGSGSAADESPQQFFNIPATTDRQRSGN